MPTSVIYFNKAALEDPTQHAFEIWCYCEDKTKLELRLNWAIVSKSNAYENVIIGNKIALQYFDLHGASGGGVPLPNSIDPSKMISGHPLTIDLNSSNATCIDIKLRCQILSIRSLSGLVDGCFPWRCNDTHDNEQPSTSKVSSTSKDNVDFESKRLIAKLLEIENQILLDRELAKSLA